MVVEPDPHSPHSNFRIEALRGAAASAAVLPTNPKASIERLQLFGVLKDRSAFRAAAKLGARVLSALSAASGLWLKRRPQLKVPGAQECYRRDKPEWDGSQEYRSLPPKLRKRGAGVSLKNCSHRLVELLSWRIWQETRMVRILDRSGRDTRQSVQCPNTDAGETRMGVPISR
jgi:hypothetical protein